MRAWDHLAPWALANNPAAHAFCAAAIERDDHKTSVAALRRLAEVMVEAGATEALAPAIEDGSLDGFEVKSEGMVIGRDATWRAWLAIQRGRIPKTDLPLIVGMMLSGWKLTAVGSPPVKGIPDAPGSREKAAEQMSRLPERVEEVRGTGVVDKGKPDVRKRSSGRADVRQGSLLGG